MARGRVQIINNNVVTDLGKPIRGNSMFLTDPTGSTSGNFILGHLYDLSFWRSYRDNYGLNTIRFHISRTPQNFGGGPGADCGPADDPPYRCYDLSYVLNSPDTAQDVIDDVVEIAKEMNMYIVVDYHPVGGFDQADAETFWDVIAPRYKDDTHVFYEACNEPDQATPYASATTTFMEDIYAYIRSRAPDTHIIMWSFGFGGVRDFKAEVDAATGISYANASVSYHPRTYAADHANVVTLRDNYPAIAAEVGLSAQTRVDECEGIGMSWLGLNAILTHNTGSVADAYDLGEFTWERDPGSIRYKSGRPRFLKVSSTDYD